MNVVVTGSSRGIGRAIAEKFLEEGYPVAGVDLREGTLSRPGYKHVRKDIRDTLPEDLPEPGILIYAAGTLEEEDALEINLRATLELNRRLESAPSVRSILFIASASARNGAEFPLYVASKAGIVGYMKNLALSVADRFVTCNSISPGGVITPANDHILNDDRLYLQVLQETLLGKWAEAEEVAELAYYLCVLNRSITGEDILMDNGEMLKSNFIW